jgi:signal peptidase I
LQPIGWPATISLRTVPIDKKNKRIEIQTLVFIMKTIIPGKTILKLSFIVLAVIVIGITLKAFIISTVIVEGNSMSPTLKHGDFVILNKWSKRFQLGDIVVFNRSNANEGAMIKRIVGTPLSSVYLDDFNLYVNGKMVAESYPLDIDRNVLECRYSTVMKSKKDEYIVLGDKRCQSSDSREHGAISLQDLKGKVIGKISLPFLYKNESLFGK